MLSQMCPHIDHLHCADVHKSELTVINTVHRQSSLFLCFGSLFSEHSGTMFRKRVLLSFHASDASYPLSSSGMHHSSHAVCL